MWPVLTTSRPVLVLTASWLASVRPGKYSFCTAPPWLPLNNLYYSACVDRRWSIDERSYIDFRVITDNLVLSQPPTSQGNGLDTFIYVPALAQDKQETREVLRAAAELGVQSAGLLTFCY
jgi:hypothetical protein